MPASDKKVALVIGASRGIGRQIAIDLAREEYAVVVAAKSTSDPSTTLPFPPDPNSYLSTINTVAREILEAGGVCTAVPVDVRSNADIQHLFTITMATYGQLDVLIYNSGAIWWSSVFNTPMSRFQLLQHVNIEGLYSAIQAALPCFEANHWRGKIVVVCPPIYSRFFRGKAAYAVGKVGMSVLVKGLAMDFERGGKSEMAITGLWPATAIQSAATEVLAREEKRELRKPTVFSDAVLEILQAEAGEVNGGLEVDEDFLKKKGVTAFGRYSVVEGAEPRRIMPVEFPDLKVREQGDEGRRIDSVQLREAKL